MPQKAPLPASYRQAPPRGGPAAASKVRGCMVRAHPAHPHRQRPHTPQRRQRLDISGNPICTPTARRQGAHTHTHTLDCCPHALRLLSARLTGLAPLALCEPAACQPPANQDARQQASFPLSLVPLPMTLDPPLAPARVESVGEQQSLG